MRDPFALAPPASEYQKPAASSRPKPSKKFYFFVGLGVGLAVILFGAIAWRLLSPAAAEPADFGDFSVSVKVDRTGEKFAAGDSLTTSLSFANEDSKELDLFALVYGSGADLSETLGLNANLLEDQTGYARKMTERERESFGEIGGSGFYLNIGLLGKRQSRTFPLKLTFEGSAGSRPSVQVKVFSRQVEMVSCGTLNLSRCERSTQFQIAADTFEFLLADQARVVLKPGYNFITLPYIFTLDAAQDFIQSISSNWAYGFVPSTGEFLDLTKGNNASFISPGVGFWVYSEKGEEVVLSESRKETNYNESYSIPLDIGWNYIGNPYAKPITLSGSQIIFREAAEDGSATGTMYSLKMALDVQALSTFYVLSPKALYSGDEDISDLARLMEWRVLPIESTLKPFIGLIVRSEKKGNLIIPGKDVVTTCGLMTDDEWRKVQEWIARSGLNQYGDPPGTVYSQGAPVDSASQPLDTCDYIVKGHPNRPWLKADY